MRLTLITLLILSMASLYGQSVGQRTYKPAAFEQTDRAQRLAKAYDAVDKIYKEYAQQNHFPAMAYGIVADGKLVHAGATGVINLKTQRTATTQSLFRIASMTKSFTAMAIMKLQEAGKLKVSDPAANYIPEIKNFQPLTIDAPPITIHNLLTMTAGFPEDNPWGDRQLEDTDQELISFLKQGVAFSTTPGEQFEYSNLGFAMLGNIISKVSGMPYQQYITKNVLEPLGMKNTLWEFSKADPDKLVLGYRWEDEQFKEEPMLHDGSFGAMGGLITSMEDFSKYVALHLDAYPVRNDADQSVVKRSSIREMHKPYMPRLFTDAKDGQGNLCPVMTGYAYGLGYRKDCKGIVRISHSGGLPGFGSEYRFYPEYGIGLICFANKTYAGAGAVNARVLDTLLAITRLKPRVLPVSDILNKRKEQLLTLLKSWDEKLGEQILAENFFLDLSRDRWIKKSKDVFDKVGTISSVGEIAPENQLRGGFDVTCEKGKVRIYFTLSPEKDPKIQQLELDEVK